MKKAFLFFSILLLATSLDAQTVTTRFRTYLMSPNIDLAKTDVIPFSSAKIGTIPANKELKVIGIDSVKYLFYKVEYKKKTGYIHRNTVYDLSYLAKQDPNVRDEFFPYVIKRTITIGMNENEVEAALGPPQKKNRTVLQNSVSEQWVYSGDRYVYLEDGIVNAFQD